MAEKPVTLTEWERQVLASHAAVVYLTYAAHKLFPHEETLKEKWRQLSDKLKA